MNSAGGLLGLLPAGEILGLVLKVPCCAEVPNVDQLATEVKNRPNPSRSILPRLAFRNCSLRNPVAFPICCKGTRSGGEHLISSEDLGALSWLP